MPHSVFNGGGGANLNGPSPKGKLLTKIEAKQVDGNHSMQEQVGTKTTPSLT